MNITGVSMILIEKKMKKNELISLINKDIKETQENKDYYEYHWDSEGENYCDGRLDAFKAVLEWLEELE